MIRELRRIIAAAALVFGTICPAAAATYRWIDDDGVVNLTNSQARFENHRKRANPDQAPALSEPQPQSSASGASLDVSRSRTSTDLRRIDGVTTDMMRLSGLVFQVELLAMTVQGEFERWRSLGFQPAGGVASIVAQKFSVDTLRANMHESLVRSLDHERTGQLLAWLRTPLAQRIVSLEMMSATAEGQQELVAFINHLPSTPPAPARLTLLHRLERAGNVTQGSAIVMAAAGAALRRTLRPFVSATGMPPRDMDAQQISAAIDENYRFRIMISLLFTYRDLSDAELGRYVALLESPTGRWFTQLTHLAFLASLEALDPPNGTGAVTAAGKRGR